MQKQKKFPAEKIIRPHEQPNASNLD